MKLIQTVSSSLSLTDDDSPVVDDVVVSGGEEVGVAEELITNGTSDFLVTAERSENTKLGTDN